MLDRLTVTTFAPAVGETFALVDEDAGRLALELLDARTNARDAPPVDAAGVRSPFSLTFRGPREPLLPQRIRRLEHHAVGALDIFLVPIGQDATSTRYQAVFG